jgi:hypothetical protein
MSPPLNKFVKNIFLPIPKGDALRAKIAPSPPELPPGVLFWFQGFFNKLIYFTSSIDVIHRFI